jgi:hypothetical protein
VGRLSPWSKRIGTALVKARANDACELCRERPVDMAHRVDASDGGPWSPSNLIALCRRCHDWTHAQPVLAGSRGHGGGWRLPSTADPREVPAFLWTEIGWRWVLLNDAGEYVNHDIVPVLPPWVPYAQ